MSRIYSDKEKRVPHNTHQPPADRWILSSHRISNKAESAFRIRFLKKSIRIVSGGGGRVVHFSKRQVTRQRRSEYLRVGLQHEERHADSYEAAGQRPLQESRAVAVEHANEGGGQLWEKTARKQAVTRRKSTQPMRSRAGARRPGSRFFIVGAPKRCCGRSSGSRT